MRRMTVIVAAIAVLAIAVPAQADLWDDARNEARNPRTQGGNSGQPAVRLLDVNSDAPGGSTAPAQPQSENGIPYFTENNLATYSPGAQGNTLVLPAESSPWGWSWFPYYRCDLSFWRTSQVGGVAVSPLEKLDSFASSRGNSEAFAAAYEAYDTRPWIAEARGLPAGHNLALAVAQAGGKTTIPWQSGSG
ncbi:MAG: hypothetical protein HY815_31720, partial [Candidatus Riflebacteria bacterium]|nr:hypothetical protein [Candidatus Riflebacteria bacterium]